MGNKIFCENFQNNLNGSLNINNDENYFKILFWKANIKDIFSFFNRKENDISELNLFYYLNEVNDNDNIFLIAIITKNNIIDLNTLFNINYGNEINISLLKVINDNKNKLNGYFFIFSKSTLNNKYINSMNIFITFINKIESTPNYLLLLYSNVNEEIKNEVLENLKNNSNNILIKSLTFIIWNYIQLIKDNNNFLQNNIINNNIKFNHFNNKIPKLVIENSIEYTILNKINNITKNNSNIQNKNINLQLQIKQNNNHINIKDISKINFTKIESPKLIKTPFEIEEEEEINDLDFNYNNPLSSSRKDYDIFDKQTSNNRTSTEMDMILDNFLYLSNYKAASNILELEKNNIKYIINCSGDICENICNYINYLTLNLKDNTKENIECVFYKCIDFINQCKKENKKILIHCLQGISRSATITIAYLIYNNKMNVDKAFNFIQKKRKIINPNLNFFLQLELFYKRLNNKEDRIQIFAITSFQIEQPNFIVARLIYHNMILNPEIKDIKPIPIFDQRGVFIFCNKNNVFIIICSKVPLNLKDIYINYAKDYIVKIRENEFLCNGNIILLNEGDYNINLEKILNDNNIKIEYGINKSLEQYYINFDNNLNKDDNINDLNINDNNNNRKGFYFYPNKEYLNILNLDDLNNEDLMIACEESENNKIFIWKGFKCNINDDDLDKYKLFVKSNFFKNNNNENNIIEINEKPYDESEDFMKLI